MSFTGTHILRYKHCCTDTKAYCQKSYNICNLTAYIDTRHALHTAELTHNYHICHIIQHGTLLHIMADDKAYKEYKKYLYE